MNMTHWRRAPLAAVCCAALAALTLAAAGATAATAGTRAAASGSRSGGAPIMTTGDGAVRGTAAGTVAEFLGIPYAAPPHRRPAVAPPGPARRLAGRPRRHPVRAELPAAGEPVPAARPR